ncbi:spore cortex biosynthesis protein [Desulfocucumis palustris]|uniref:Spore cortex biosynthesis protein n=1 Tax=Desulfocucumis palustris TaxID=1898651 RepID=A0A2L2X983_9FIRM|nr:spore cortex biosynthesis protein YabQ [Desulfocucumis palustris]GBF32153.1 spore cortex biosynthesis protein [Desulfocucumis palustris]
MPLAEQIYLFIMLLTAGMLAGFCYDLYKMTRSKLRLKKTGTFLGDIFFWLFLTCVSFYLLLRLNAGEVRIYVFLGLALGTLLYMQLMGKTTYRLLDGLFSLIGKLIKIIISILLFLWKIITTPFRILFIIVIFPFRLIARFFSFTGRGSKKFARRLVLGPAGRLKAGLLLKLKSIWTKLKPGNKT